MLNLIGEITDAILDVLERLTGRRLVFLLILSTFGMTLYLTFNYFTRGGLDRLLNPPILDVSYPCVMQQIPPYYAVLMVFPLSEISRETGANNNVAALIYSQKPDIQAACRALQWEIIEPTAEEGLKNIPENRRLLDDYYERNQRILPQK